MKKKINEKFGYYIVNITEEIMGYEFGGSVLVKSKPSELIKTVTQALNEWRDEDWEPEDHGNSYSICNGDIELSYNTPLKISKAHYDVLKLYMTEV